MNRGLELAGSRLPGSRLTGLQLTGLRITAGTRVLVDHLSHRFGGGELWVIAGPNGAGKTTLIEVIAGLRKPAAGEVDIDARPLGEWRVEPLARRRALMPQVSHDAFGATVLETVLVARHPYLQGWGWENEADTAAAHAALEALDMAGFAMRDVTSLSGGERQRVALAAALCQQAPLLLLDEPLAHLDLRHQVECLEVLRGWVAALPEERTVLLSCHDLNLARRFATHALLLDGAGGVIAGKVADVLSAEHASRAFGFELVLLRDGEHEVLVPRLSPGLGNSSP
jgi:iron complex transport system ATP-binding protein